MDSTTEPESTGPESETAVTAEATEAEGTAGEEQTDGQSQPSLLVPSSRRGKRYQRYRMRLAAGEWLVEVAVLMTLLAAGWSIVFRRAARAMAADAWLVVLLYLIPMGLLFALVSLVFSAVRTFVLDRRFGLSHQTAGDWAADEIKGIAVAGVLVLIAVETLYGLLRRFPDTWWLWTGLAFTLFFVVIAQLAPVLIFPLFYRFTPVTDPEITERLAGLARRAGTPIRGVYEADFSRKTRTANAALAGLGRTRRILLADNLLNNFTLDEIEAVLAHEFAHHAERHLPKIVAIQAATFFVLFYAIHRVLGAVGSKWGLEGPADIANLPLLGLTATFFGLLILPLTNALLRRFERRADRYALRVARKPRALCSALLRLAQLNLADRSPHPLVEWIFYSHPSIERRVQHAERILEERGDAEPAAEVEKAELAE